MGIPAVVEGVERTGRIAVRAFRKSKRLLEKLQLGSRWIEIDGERKKVGRWEARLFSRAEAKTALLCVRWRLGTAAGLVGCSAPGSFPLLSRRAQCQPLRSLDLCKKR